MDAGFGSALAEREGRRFLILVACVFAMGVAIGFAGLIAWRSQSAPEPTWDEWLDEHKKTCPTCQRAWDSADSAMCEEAFEKFKETLRKENR